MQNKCKEKAIRYIENTILEIGVILFKIGGLFK